jgi:hypothetical protein
MLRRYQWIHLYRLMRGMSRIALVDGSVSETESFTVTLSTLAEKRHRVPQLGVDCWGSTARHIHDSGYVRGGSRRPGTRRPA